MYAGSVALILNPEKGHVSPQYHVVYDKTFSTVSHMRDETIPPTLDNMCKSSVESSIRNTFDLAELWFKHLTDILEDPFTDNVSDDVCGRTLTPEGASNKPNLTENSEGENKVSADAITRKSVPNLASMTGRKGVSCADVQYGINKPSFSRTNKGEQTKMPNLVHLLQSDLHHSERIRKSQNTKEAEESHPKNRNAFTAKRSLAFYTVISTLILNSQQELWIQSLMTQPIINRLTGFMRPMSCMMEH